LASFGMYRGSAFLLQYPYTVHLGVVDCLLESNFSKLWPEEFEFGAGEKDEDLVPLILKACEDVRTAYRRFADAKHKRVTDTLRKRVRCALLSHRAHAAGHDSVVGHRLGTRSGRSGRRGGGGLNCSAWRRRRRSIPP
jgi:hypothetical protein